MIKLKAFKTFVQLEKNTKNTTSLLKKLVSLYRLLDYKKFA